MTPGDIVQRTIFGTPFVPKAKHYGLGRNPCSGCPFEGRPQTLPKLVSSAKFIVVSKYPASKDEGPFPKTIATLARLLKNNNVDVEELSWVTLTRCRPKKREIYDGTWVAARRKCSRYLELDIQGKRDVVLDPKTSVPVNLTPMVLLGETSTLEFVRNTARGIQQVWNDHGIWVRSKDETRVVLPTLDLDDHIDAPLVQQKEAFRVVKKDIERACDGVAHMDKHDKTLKIEVLEKPTMFESWFDANESRLKSSSMISFDCETYDAREVPSRIGVAVDACHPDLRLRGLAISFSEKGGVFVNTTGWAKRSDRIRPMFDRLFSLPVPKVAHNGTFDQEVLTFNRNGCQWVSRIENRCFDTMFALLALGDTVEPRNLRLDTTIMDVLGESQHWIGVNKSYMKNTPLDVVAAGAVYDTTRTLMAAKVLHERLLKGEYF